MTNPMKSLVESVKAMYAEQSANTNAPVSIDKNQDIKKKALAAAAKTANATQTSNDAEGIVQQGSSAETFKEEEDLTRIVKQGESMTADKDDKKKKKDKESCKEETELDEASYSAKAARAGKDIGKPGKQFGKIAASAGKKYGSAEAGKRVAGSILAKLRNEEVELDEMTAKEKKLAAMGHPKDKITKKDVLIGRGVLAKEDVDFTEYTSIDVEVTEETGYIDYLKAALTALNIASVADIAEENRQDFFTLVDECFNNKDDILFVESWMNSDIADKIKAHEKAGNKVSDQKRVMKGGTMEHSFVVTQPSGKRTRHVYHGNARRLETMSPAPKSKEAHETGEDEDDK